MNLCEETLTAVKARFFGPTEDAFDYADSIAMREVTALLQRLHEMTETMMLAEYNSWRDQYPGMTFSIIQAVRKLEAAEERALRTYLRLTDPKRSAA